MAKAKLNFIFVGGFRQRANDGGVGGQLYACRTLLNSPISQHVTWFAVDSTLGSIAAPALSRRLVLAMKRISVLFKLLVKRRIDGVLIFTSASFSFLEKGLMVLLSCLFRKRVVLSPRSGLLLDDLKRSKFMRRYIAFVLRRCNAIICQSNSWKQVYEALSGLPESHFIVVKNWIDVKPYIQLTADYKITSERPVNVLFMGGIERKKGIFDLVEAVNCFRNDLSNTRFFICGGGAELKSIKQRLVNLRLSQWFSFPGWVLGAEKMSMFKKADIFVLPSYREGMPNALLEAMAAGKAVIATKVGGIPEVITDNSVGRLFDAGDIQALGHTLVELSRNPFAREKLGAKARQHVLAHHDITQIWPQVLATLAPD